MVYRSFSKRRMLALLVVLLIACKSISTSYGQTQADNTAKNAVKQAQVTQFQNDYDSALSLVNGLPEVIITDFDVNELIELPIVTEPSIDVDSTWEVINECNSGEYLDEYIITVAKQNFQLKLTYWIKSPK